LQEAEFGPDFSALRAPANALKRVSAAFLSDTVVIAVEMKRDLDMPGVEGANQLLDAAAVVYAARFAGTVMRLGASLEPRWNYRGAISFGKFSMRSGFMIGPAVDSAVERMDLAQGAFVWLTPEAYDVATRRFPSGFGSPWPLTRYAVPLKQLGALETLVASPFDFKSDAAGRALLREDILSGFTGTALDVVLKRQNTAQFLEHHMKEFREQPAGHRHLVLTGTLGGRVILAALGADDSLTVLPEPPHRPRLPVSSGEDAAQLIAELPAIRAWVEVLDQHSRDGNVVRLGMTVESTPRPDAALGSDERVWRIAVFESHKTHRSNHRRFLVDADTGMIFRLDPVTGARLPDDATTAPPDAPR
jgi:hypothetical protein